MPQFYSRTAGSSHCFEFSWEVYFNFLCISINKVCDIPVLVLDRLIKFPVFSQANLNEFLTCFVNTDEFIVNWLEKRVNFFLKTKHLNTTINLKMRAACSYIYWETTDEFRPWRRLTCFALTHEAVRIANMHCSLTLILIEKTWHFLKGHSYIY